MSRAQEFMNEIWTARNSGADTESKLVASILRLASERVVSYNAQNGIIVLDKNDLLELSHEVEETAVYEE
jgi:hypothetical protein